MVGPAWCSFWNWETDDEERDDYYAVSTRANTSQLYFSLSSITRLLGRQSSTECFIAQRTDKQASLDLPSYWFESECLFWHMLPDLVLGKIYWYLNDKDRCQASQTCSSWNAALYDPRLWRSHHFVFSGTSAYVNSDCYGTYLTSLGKYMKTMSVKLARPTFDTAASIALTFEQFVTKVNNVKGLELQHFRLVVSNFSDNWGSFLHRKTIIQSMCSLLKKQPLLESADLSYCQMERDEGIRVLNAVSYGSRTRSKGQLRDVKLQRFFGPRARPLRSQHYDRAMGYFISLVTLRIDVRSLGTNVIQILAQCSNATFRRLELDYYGQNVFAQAVNTECWGAVMEILPDLEVVVHIHRLCLFPLYDIVLARKMPLIELYVDDGGTVNLHQAELDSLSALLLHLASDFWATLRKLSVMLQPYVDPNVDVALVNLVASCPFLVDIKLGLIIEAGTVLDMVEAICNLAREQMAARGKVLCQPPAQTTRLHLHVRGINPDIEKAIRDVTIPLDDDAFSGSNSILPPLISPPTVLNVGVIPDLDAPPVYTPPADTPGSPVVNQR